jgi:hypothetical protein
MAPRLTLDFNSLANVGAGPPKPPRGKTAWDYIKENMAAAEKAKRPVDQRSVQEEADRKRGAVSPLGGQGWR